MDLTPELMQQLAAGASGGIPISLLIFVSFRSLRQSMDQLKDRLEKFSSRLQRLEVAFEVHFQSEIKRLSDNQAKLEARIHSIETAASRLQK